MNPVKRFIRALALCCALFLVVSVAPPVAEANTTITVNTTVDSATHTCAGGPDPCSLRSAIIKANNTAGPVTILLPAGTYTLTIEGRLERFAQTGSLDIRNPNITIIGSLGNGEANPLDTIIQAGPSMETGIDRVFVINPTLDQTQAWHATFKALTIQHGRNEDAFAQLWGGGLFWDAGNGGTFTMDNVVIRNNMTTRSHGGGLLLSNMKESGGQITIARSTITGNESHNGSGGGIWINGEIPTTISDSVISNNKSIHGGTRGGAGGGLYAEHGPTVAVHNPIRITRSIISGNEATESQGGGIYTIRPLELTYSTVSGNFAKEQGGGIWANPAEAGLVVMANVTISGNTSNGYGGGYYQSLNQTGQAATLTNVTITNNRSVATGTFHDPNADGGGIYLNQSSGTGTIVLRNSIVAGNLRGTGSVASDARGGGSFHAANSTHNLIGTGGSGGLTHGTNDNLVNIESPRLGPLQHNGGAAVGALSSTAGIRLNPLTHALLPGSPALDAGSNSYANSLFLTTDQRGTGFQRISDAADANTTKTVDIGAYEAHPMIEDIQDQSMLQDTVHTVDFHWGDTTRSVSAPVATSSNTALLPNGAISWGSPQPNVYRLTLTPATGQYGQTTITVSKSAEIAGHTVTKTDTFVLTVRPRPDLTVTKTHAGNFRQGQQEATYTITVSNLGPGYTEGTVTLTDSLPEGLTLHSMSGTGWTCGGLTCTRSDVLNPGASYPPITLKVNVANNAAVNAPGHILTNTAVVSGGADNTPGNNTANDPTYIVQVADLTVNVSHVGDFRQGQQQAPYNIRVSNVGYGPTDEPFSMTVTLPTGLTLHSLSGTGWTCPAGSLTCTRTTPLAKDAHTDITLMVNVALRAPENVNLTASVAGGGENNTGNNTHTDPTHIIPVADLRASITPNGTFRQGQQNAEYHIRVENEGDGNTDDDMALTVTLPPLLTLVSLTGEHWTCDEGTCEREEVLAKNAWSDLTLVVAVADNAPASVITQVAVAGGGEANTANNSGSHATSIIQVADLTVSMSHDAPFRQGQQDAVYTIRVDNVGPGATDEPFSVAVTLRDGLTVSELTGDSGWTCDDAAVNCTRSTALNSGAWSIITLKVDVAHDAAASGTSSVVVSGGGEIKTDNNADDDPTQVTQVADLTIAKTHVGDFVQGQTGATYTITVSNAGPGPTDAEVVVTDTLPTGITATGISGDGWDCTLTPELRCTRPVSSPIASGASAPPITLTVNVAVDASEELTNTASVSGGGELNTGNNTAADLTTILQKPDLTVTKTHTGNFRQGQAGATYTITVTNSGTASTEGLVTVTDELPAGLTATGMAGDGWTCTLGTLTCTRSDVLAQGSSYPPITLMVTVAVDAPATLTNTVTVAGGGELITDNNTASDLTEVDQASDLTIAKAVVGSFTQGDSSAAYTITVSNVGLGPTAGEVEVTDSLPTGLTAVTISGTGWDCDLVTLTCTRSDVLAAGGSYPVITLTVSVDAYAPPSVTNTATVSGGGELNTANNTAEAVTPIAQRPDLTISKTHTGNFRQGQTGATYTITVTNSGTGLTSGTVTVSDTLPAGLTATVMAGDGWNCNLAALTCTRSDVLAAGESYPAITLTVNVATDAPASLTNTAAVSGGGDVDPTNNDDEDETTVVQASDVTVTMTHTGDFRQGQKNAAYTIRVQNVGPGASDEAIVAVITLPAGLTKVSLDGGDDWDCDLDSLTCTRTLPLASGAYAPDITLLVDVPVDAPASVTPQVTVSGGGEIRTDNNAASDPTNIIQVADLIVERTLPASFRQGQTGATYTLTVSNVGPGPTEGAVTVTETLPAGLTFTDMTGTGWVCETPAPGAQTLTCTRSDVLAAGSTYPTITVAVDVADDAAATLAIVGTVSGGGEVNTENSTATDAAVVVQVADLTITKTHRGNFVLNQSRASYTIVVSNVGPGPTDAPVTVVDTLPTSLTATELSGEGWTCDLATLTCNRADALAPGASYPAITLMVNVAPSAPSTVTNVVTVSGGGQLNLTNDQASDLTRIVPPEPASRITIVPPVPFTNAAAITITGTANPGSFITIGATTVQADLQGNWSALVALNEGLNEITAVNASVYATVTVTRISRLPSIRLTASASVTEGNQVLLTAASDDDVEIRIEGQETATLTVSLVPGENTFTATAVDRAGNQSAASVTVVRLTAPELGALPAVVSRPEIQVSGTHWAGRTVTLVVNGTDVGSGLVDESGSFTLDGLLTEGVNRVAVKSGSLTSREVVVVYQKQIPLKDVPGHWAARSIERMVELGVVRGYEDSTFRPEAQVSRVEFAVMMARLLGLVPGDNALTFTDSSAIPEWGAQQVAAAVRAGIITGRADGSFDPHAPVTRAEVAIMLTRAMRYAGLDAAPGSASFADRSEIPAWALEQVLAAAEAGLITGYQDGTFRAGNTATRAEAVTMLTRLLDFLSR